MAATSSRYYPYIDGLRALAVLSVLIFHLDGSWLPGGFVGVDVFFVISGFVVSASITRFQGRGLWQLLVYFYARRIQRIFPALIVCLLLTTYLSVLLIPRSWLSSVNQDTGLYAFFGLSNFILALSGRDYFAPITDFNPYAHTWSLAVEEQFYVIFPFLFLAWLGGRKGRRLSVRLFAAGLLLSAFFSVWQSQADPTLAYFLTPSRFWELAAGVLLYQSFALRPLATMAPAGKMFYPLLGTSSLICLLGAFVVSPAEGFPMPGALPAVLGTVGVIFSLHDRPQLKRLHGLLGSRPLVSIGRISYSLYLWHWPVFVLFRWTYGLDAFWPRFIAVVLTFGLAVLSCHLIENPFRHGRLVRRMPHRAVIALGLFVIGMAWHYNDELGHSGHLSLSTVNRNSDLWYPHGPATVQGYPGCVAGPEHHDVGGGLLQVYRPHGCAVPQPLGSHSIYVLGDSHAQSYAALFKQYAIRHSVRIYAYNNGGCPFLSMRPETEGEQAYCGQYLAAALEDLRQRTGEGDILFLPSLRLPRFSDQWTYYGEDEAFAEMSGPQWQAARQRDEAYAAEVLSEFAERGVQIVFPAPTPLFKAPPFRCADPFTENNPICRQGFAISRARFEAFRRPVLDSLARISAQLPHSGIWDPAVTLCSADRCDAWQNGSPLFFDSDHLSGFGNLQLLPVFSEYMGDRLAQARAKTYARKLLTDVEIDMRLPPPEFLTRLDGLSRIEGWGRWSDANLGGPIRLDFAAYLPSSFVLEITASAYGPNSGLPVKILIGGIEKEVIFTEQPSTASVSYANIGKATTIEILPPRPVSPRELGISEDARRLGLGLVRIALHAAEAGSNTQNDVAAAAPQPQTP